MRCCKGPAGESFSEWPAKRLGKHCIVLCSRISLHGGTVTIRNFGPNDVGLYECRVESAHGSAVKSIRVTMKGGCHCVCNMSTILVNHCNWLSFRFVVSSSRFPLLKRTSRACSLLFVSAWLRPLPFVEASDYDVLAVAVTVTSPGAWLTFCFCSVAEAYLPTKRIFPDILPENLTKFVVGKASKKPGPAIVYVFKDFTRVMIRLRT